MKPLASEDLLDSECERTAWDKESVGEYARDIVLGDGKRSMEMSI